MEASIILLLLSVGLALSSFFDAFSKNPLGIKVSGAALSLLLAILPLSIKLYFFYCEKRSRWKLFLDATVRYFLGDAFPLYNFRAWCGEYSTYCNIFCDKKAFFSNDFNCISRMEPSVGCRVIKAVTFGHMSVNDPNFTPKKLAESQASYVTERVHFNKGDGGGATKGTLVVRDYDVEYNGSRYAGFKGEMFVRGDHKFERRARFLPSEWNHVTYPKVYQTPSMGEVKVTLRYEPTNAIIDYKVQTTDFPEGQLTPKVQNCDINIFIKCIVMLEYMPDCGWVTYTNNCLGRRRRNAFVFHSRSLNGYTEEFKLGADLCEVRQETDGLPCFIEDSTAILYQFIQLCAEKFTELSTNMFLRLVYKNKVLYDEGG